MCRFFDGDGPSPARRQAPRARRVRALGAFALATLALPGGGPNVLRLNHKLAPGQDVALSLLGPDGQHLFYVVTEAGFDAGQLYRVPADGSHAKVALTAPLPAGRDFYSIQVSSDAQRVAFTADRDTAGRYELFSVVADGSAAPVKLNGPLPPSGAGVYPGFFRFTPDGSRVVYLVQSKLYSVLSDGSQPPVQLSTAFLVGLFQFSPDGARVVFKSADLYSVPVDGSAAPTQLSNSTVGGIPLTEYQISPDGQYVVYRSWTFDGNGDPTYRIFSAPIDGSVPPALLFAPVFEGLFPTMPIFHISPDSQRVVHRSDPDQYYSSNVRKLESAPIDGSTPPVLLNDPYGPGGGIGHDFCFAANGSVVYGFGPGGGGVPFGIYVVPVDGSAAPLRITPTTTFPSPTRWEVAPFNRVVFVGFTGSYEIFSVPLDGSQAPVRLNPPLVPGGNVTFGGTDPRGRSILYQGDQDTDEVVESYMVAIDGSTPARKVNRPLAPGGDVLYDGGDFTPDGRSVVYAADQQEDEKYEVFLSAITDPWIEDVSPLPDGQGVHR